MQLKNLRTQYDGKIASAIEYNTTKRNKNRDWDRARARHTYSQTQRQTETDIVKGTYIYRD